MQITDIVRRTIIQFCQEFVEHPYLCYTEHGQHALFYNKLYNALPRKQRHITWQDQWQDQKVQVVQKEYPTAGKLNKSRRQNWDIAVIKTPVESMATECRGYDYLKLAAVVEFGMNATVKHLKGDIKRLCHPDANLAQRFIVHLYRLSKPGAVFSGRDWSSNSTRIITREDVCKLPTEEPIEIYYAMAGSTDKHDRGTWCIQEGECLRLDGG